ncbi:MAG TPA: hypothetical protein EYQ72_04435 [Gammaproteobacteria bacterium]|jgi:hypothetical protein|nr:hypothetical protein [Gammaproteobacteria bacterium]
MNIQQRNLYLLALIVSSLSGCSFFNASVQTCNEPQEYLNSYSIADLVIPDALREIQKQSSFYISKDIDNNLISREEMLPVMRDEIKSAVKEKENISGDDLSELLDLIDQTIDGRTNAFDQGNYDVKSTTKRTNNLTDDCLEEAPNYFADGVLENNGSKRLSEKTINDSEEGKSWWKKLKDRRKNRAEEKQI